MYASRKITTPRRPGRMAVFGPGVLAGLLLLNAAMAPALAAPSYDATVITLTQIPCQFLEFGSWGRSRLQDEEYPRLPGDQ